MGKLMAEPLTKMAAWMLMLTGSLLNFLNFNSYPLFQPEVAILIAGFVPLAAAFGGLELAAPRLAFVFTGVLVGFGADLNMEASIWPLLVGFAVLAAAWFNNTATVKVVSAAFATVVLFQFSTGATNAWSSSAAAHPARAAAPQDGPPPIVHLVLDSYVGLEGMAADPAYAELRNETQEFYRRYGFRLYHDAYSRHARTANSVPHFLSFGTAAPAQVSQFNKRLLPGPLAYFDLLAAHGYNITVRGAGFIDLCTGQPVKDCRQYPHSGLAALTKFPLSTVDRAKTLAVTLLSMSSPLSKTYNQLALLMIKFDVARPMGIRGLAATSTPAAVLSLNEIRADLAKPRYGEVYFAHLLLPHEPYVFDENCAIKPRSQWHTEAEGASTPVRISDYQNQTRCMHRLLGDLFEVLQRSPAGRDAVVIIQGDHGSRIVSAHPTIERPNANPLDYAMTYSTMFAIRGPAIEPGTSRGRAALDELLRDFAEKEFVMAPAAGIQPAEIILATRDWIPRRRVPLPTYLD